MNNLQTMVKKKLNSDNIINHVGINNVKNKYL